MRNKDRWQPSKFDIRDGELIASKDAAQLHPGSRLYAQLVANAFQRNLKKFAHGDIIDLGCGKAPLFGVYRHRASLIICTDRSSTNLHLDFESDVCSPLPIRSESFDSIILSDVLEHIPNPELLWHEMARIIKDQGKLLLSVPFYYGLHEAPDDYYRYTEFALRHFASLSGLKILILEPLGGTPEIFADLLAKHVSQIPLIGIPLAKAVQVITLAFVRQGLGKWISIRTRTHFPIGYFLVAEKPPGR
jgi:SAM-dependent methyltransferase